jgi:ABC-2 type transport system permease protein
MNKLAILLKNNFNVMIGNLFSKKKTRKIKPSVGIFVALFLGFLALSSLQAYSQFFGLAPLGLTKLPLLNGVMITFLILVIYVSMKVTAKPKTNDTDLLLSLPIKKSTVALSKVLSRYLFDFLVAFLLLVPYITFYLIYEGFSLPILFGGLSVVILIPLLSVGLNYILDFVVTHLFNKTKYSLILKSAFAFIIFAFSMVFFVIAMPSFSTLDPAQVDTFIRKFGPLSWFLNFILTQNFVSLLSILAITVLPFMLGVALYTKNLGKTFATYQTKQTELVFLNSKGVLNSLIKKELRAYFYTPIYVLNTIIGPVFMIGFTVFIAIKGASGLSQMLGATVPQEMLFAMLTLAFCFFMAVTLISPSAISLEGKQLWILKSTPSSEHKILFSKAFPNIILTVPVIIISAIVLSITLKFNLLQAVLFAVIPSLMALSISFGGLLINLLFPKLDWVEETQVVKQSLSIGVAMLAAFMLAALPVALFYLLPNFSIVTLAIITLLLHLAICITVTILLFTKGKKMWLKL